MRGEGGIVVIREHRKCMGSQWEERDLALTDDHGPYRWLIKDPSGGDVGDADAASTISNRS